MWSHGAEEQEVQRFTFRIGTAAPSPYHSDENSTNSIKSDSPDEDESIDCRQLATTTTAASKLPGGRVRVTIVGVKPATFNTATFLQRDSEKKQKRSQHNNRDEDSSGLASKDEGQTADKTLFCVTSHVVWRTSQLMASWMASHAALFAPDSGADRRQLRVLELGCGLGLAGLACAKICAALRRRGPLRSDTPSPAEPALVVMTDGDAAALQLLEHNVELNWTGEPEGRPQVAQLVWGDRPCMRQLKATHGGRGFDVVLGADIIYHRTDYEALVETIRFFLTDDDGDDDDRPRHEEEEDQVATIANEEALVVIAMQERQYGALDHLVQLMRTRLGMAARTLDVPRMFAAEADNTPNGDRCDDDDEGDDEDDEGGEEDKDDTGDYIGSNHYMVIFHHPRTRLDLGYLGHEVNLEEEEENLLLLSMSPP